MCSESFQERRNLVALASRRGRAPASLIGFSLEPKVGISRALRAYAATFGDVRPVSTMVAVDGFLDPLWKVEIEAEAILD